MKLLLVTLLLTSSLYFFSCNNKSGEKDALTSLSDSTSASGLTGDSVKLVKTAGINFKVKDVEKSTRTVSGLAGNLEG